MVPTSITQTNPTRRHQQRQRYETTTPSLLRLSSSLATRGVSSDDSYPPVTTPNPFFSALGPVSLLGGTAAVYASVLRHPSSTLTPLSLFYMMLLALQYTLQPRLSRKYISKQSNKKVVALAEEVVKTGLAAAVLVWNTSRRHSSHTAIFQDWSLASSLTVAGLPAVLYAAQGVLQYTAHQYLDPVTFNGLTQTKTLSAALCCFLVMGKPQSPLQMVALVLLLASALLFQQSASSSGNHSWITKWFPPKNREKAKNDSERKEIAQKAHFPRDEEWFVKGVIPCLAATFLSGLAGALSQKGLQLTGGRGRDPFLYTVEISLFSAFTLIVDLVRQPQIEKAEKTTHPRTTTWTAQTWIPIVFKAAGGVLTALVHKHAGSVAKGFALLVGLVLSGLVQSMLGKREEGGISPQQTIATLLCLLSGWMHFTNPPN